MHTWHRGKRSNMPHDFWSRIEHGESCWTWGGTIGSGGYGEFKLDGVTWKAHRLAFFLSFGFIAEVIAHKCDNVLCANPQHLFALTHKGERVPDPSSVERLRGVEAWSSKNQRGRRFTDPATSW